MSVLCFIRMYNEHNPAIGFSNLPKNFVVTAALKDKEVKAKEVENVLVVKMSNI